MWIDTAGQMARNFKSEDVIGSGKISSIIAEQDSVHDQLQTNGNYKTDGSHNETARDVIYFGGDSNLIRGTDENFGTEDKLSEKITTAENIEGFIDFGSKGGDMSLGTKMQFGQATYSSSNFLLFSGISQNTYPDSKDIFSEEHEEQTKLSDETQMSDAKENYSDQCWNQKESNSDLFDPITDSTRQLQISDSSMTSRSIVAEDENDNRVSCRISQNSSLVETTDCIPLEPGMMGYIAKVTDEVKYASSLVEEIVSKWQNKTDEDIQGTIKMCTYLNGLVNNIMDGINRNSTLFDKIASDEGQEHLKEIWKNISLESKQLKLATDNVIKAVHQRVEAIQSKEGTCHFRIS